MVRDATFLVANSALGAAAGFLFWLLAARLAAPSEVGRAAAYVSAFSLAALLGRCGLDAVLVRHLGGLAPSARTRLVVGSLAVAALASTGVALAFVALGLSSAAGAGEVALFVGAAAAVSAGWILDGWFLAERRTELSFARNVVYNGGRLALLAVPLVGLGGAWGLAAAASLAVALFGPWRRAVDGATSPPPILKTAASNHAVGVAEMLPALALPVLVAGALGPEANAAFYVAWTLAMVGVLAVRAVAQSAFAAMANGRGADATARALRLQALLVVPALLLGPLLARPVLGVFGPHYVSAAPVLLVLLVALVPASVNALALAAYKAQGRATRLVVVAWAVALPAVALGWWLAPWLGVAGPALAWLAANALVLPWTVPTVLPRWNLAARQRGRAHEG